MGALAADQQPAGVTVEDAARDLACTIRTIWRDLSALQDAGFPMRFPLDTFFQQHSQRVAGHQQMTAQRSAQPR
ncbi:MAG: hypothetical protein ACRELS_13830 [Candidatus Rokuibacteriota bacterium]